MGQEILERVVEVTLGDIIKDPLVNVLKGPPRIGEHGHTPLLTFTVLQDGTRLGRVQETAVLNQDRHERLLILEAIPSRKAESINTRQVENITIVPKGLEVRIHHILGVAGSGGERLKLCLTSMPILLLCSNWTTLTAVSSTLPGGERCSSSTSPARWRARDEPFTPLIFIEEGVVDSRTMKAPGSRIVVVT
jgi:hypothetical protein